ncbi:Quinate permease [Cyphellophora attinorum]|uniref:Quinate permease n=1 Tax=Cyphellophora attinorum TaxID=1664694 RepID=A0A0N1GYX2_9EURO|nr:Quinate permease [Phialophora attinorum]KPI36135.1 Quinate permease [Phialophora attinorum]
MALDSFKRDYGLEGRDQHEIDTLQGNIVSTFQSGCFFGALLAFPVAERIGRKRSIMIASLIFLVGAILMTASNGRLPVLITGRAIAGLGIGAVSLIVPVYISETSPPSIRGRLVGIFEICSQFGGMTGFWINYAVNRTISEGTKTQWIVPLAVQLLPGTILFLGMLCCPETPRFMAKKDNWEAQRRFFASYARCLPIIHTFVENLPTFQFKRLFQKGTRNRIGLGLILMMCQNMTGVNIITYYSPRIFQTLGITGTSTKLFATGFYGIAKTLGMIVFSLWLVEKVGRRNGLIYGAFIGSLPMWYIGGYVFKADPTAALKAGNATRSGWAYLAMVCVYLYGFIYCATWQGITWVYCSEIFPLDIRLLCVAITTADQWLWSFIISRTTPYMITSLGYGTYMFFGALMLLMGVWAFFFVPETKGKTLEQMETLFGAPSAESEAEKVVDDEKPVGMVHVENQAAEKSGRWKITRVLSA